MGDYYNLCNLNATMLLPKDYSVIYAFNLFFPKAYIDVGDVNYTVDWPGQIRCCDVTKSCLPGKCPQNACDAMVDVDRDWLEEVLHIPIKGFRDAFDVPVLVDQWGVYYNSPNRTGYDADVLSLMRQYGVSSTNWQW